MKKFLLSLAVVLGMGAVAQAADVTLPGTDKKWNAYTWNKAGDDFNATVEGYTLTLAKGTSSNALVAPDQYSIRVYAGANLTVTAPAGTTFKQVVVKGAADSNATNATATGWTVSCSGKAGATFVATFTSVTPKSSITFDGAGKQLRVGSITLGDGSGTVDPTPDPDPTPSVTTYDGFAAFAAAGTGAEGQVNGPISVIYQKGKDLQVKDSKGAYMLVYGSVTPTDLVNGDVLASVKGKYDLYNNQPEVTNATLGEVTKGGVAIEPEELALNAITADKVNAYVKLTGVNVTDVNKSNFNLKDAAGNTLAGYNTFNISGLSESTGQTVIGFVRLFKGNVQIAPVSIEGGVVLEAVAEPTFSVAAGAVEKGTKVSILCATEGASIHYTTDGSDVSASSPDYSAPIVINEAMTIKAIAVKEGMKDSPVATAAYTIKAETSGEPIIVFKSNASDASAEITSKSGLAQIESGAKYVKSLSNITKVYSGVNGLKFSTGSKNGKLQINLVDPVKCKQIIVNAQKYNSDATSLAVNECAAQTLGQTPADYIYDMKSEKISYITLAATKRLYVKSITIVVDPTPDAPVLEMPEGFSPDNINVTLTDYTNEATKNYFEVKVSWPEGMTLHYETYCRGTQLDGVTLPYSEEQKALDFAAGNNADKTLTHPLTGDLTGAAAVSRSAGTNTVTFGFASQGTFECYVVDAAGNQSDKKPLIFQGQSTGVEDIVADGEKGEAVFYNMQGVRVANPAAGNLYIKVQGDKATKVLVK